MNPIMAQRAVNIPKTRSSKGRGRRNTRGNQRHMVREIKIMSNKWMQQRRRN
jgi:hypothetical protein